jgi:pseudoazurin
MHPIVTRVIAAASLAFFASVAHAADIQVKLLNKSESEGLFAFEPTFVKADVGDTLVFIPTDTGHNTLSLLIPSGAQSWRSPYDKEFRVKLEKEGVYLYACDAHKRMGMVGLVQVGNAVNLEEARKRVADESAAMAMNKDRFTKAIEKVK